MTSDNITRDRVEASLQWEPSIDVGSIGVAVKDGIATLTGEVPSLAESHAAERIAACTTGVQAVANELESKAAHLDETTDTDLAAAIVHALKWQHAIPHDDLTVVVKDGWITLGGQVPWAYQKREIAEMARALTGARGITNSVTVEVRPIAADVENDITEAFKRTAVLDSEGITVTVNGDQVELWGFVRSWDERRTAVETAERAPGVRSVSNHLTIR